MGWIPDKAQPHHHWHLEVGPLREIALDRCRDTPSIRWHHYLLSPTGEAGDSAHVNGSTLDLYVPAGTTVEKWPSPLADVANVPLDPVSMIVPPTRTGGCRPADSNIIPVTVPVVCEAPQDEPRSASTSVGAPMTPQPLVLFTDSVCGSYR
jgi:hypothetical protein